MSSRKARHLAMQAILRGSAVFGLSPDFAHVDRELAELGSCNRLQPLNRQRLLQVIHASRALDTCLRSLLLLNGKKPDHGIGKMLHQLKLLPPQSRAYLDHSTATAFVSSIAHTRNRYAHRAASFPTSTQEVDKLVAEVQACLASIL